MFFFIFLKIFSPRLSTSTGFFFRFNGCKNEPEKNLFFFSFHFQNIFSSSTLDVVYESVLIDTTLCTNFFGANFLVVRWWKIVKPQCHAKPQNKSKKKDKTRKRKRRHTKIKLIPTSAKKREGKKNHENGYLSIKLNWKKKERTEEAEEKKKW